MLRYCPLIVALILVSIPLDLAAAGATVNGRIGPAFGDATVQAPTGSKVFTNDSDGELEYAAFIVILGGTSGIDLFGFANDRTTGDFDPYNAFSIQLTNLTPDAQTVEIQVLADIFATGSPNSIELLLDAEVRDTNNDGDAALAGGRAIAAGINSAYFAFMPFASNDAYAPGPGVSSIVFDVNSAGPDFAPFGTNTIEQLFMSVIGY